MTDSHDAAERATTIAGFFPCCFMTWQQRIHCADGGIKCMSLHLNRLFNDSQRPYGMQKPSTLRSQNNICSTCKHTQRPTVITLAKRARNLCSFTKWQSVEVNTVPQRNTSEGHAFRGGIQRATEHYFVP